MTKKNEIKKPWGLQLIIYSFLIAPFGNIAMTAAVLGIADWYKPEVYLHIMANIQVLDYLWLGFIFASGVLLMARHKTAWIVAVTVLSATVLINVRNLVELMNSTSASPFAISQLLISLLATSAVGVIFFYFRYPYLDRRATLFGFASRVDVKIPSVIHFSSESFQTKCDSISITGARFTIKSPDSKHVENESLSVQFSAEELEIKAVVVQHTNDVLSVKFIEMTSDQKSKLIRMVKTHRNVGQKKDLNSNETIPSKIAS